MDKIVEYKFPPDLIFWNWKEGVFDLEESYLEEISRIVAEILQKLLKSDDVKGRETSFVLLDRNEIKSYKKEYFGVELETDVISIPLYEKGRIPEKGYYLLGEIYLSPVVIKENGMERGLKLEEEFFYIVIHGILHLLGYDDIKDEERKEMFALQDKLFSEYRKSLGKWVKK